MESIYGIGVKNRYDLLNDDADPSELLRQQEAERERRRAEKLQKAKADKLGKQSINASKKGQNKELSPVPPPAKLPESPKKGSTEVLPPPSKPPRVRLERPRRDQEDQEERQNRRNREEARGVADASEGVPRGGRDEGSGRGRGGRGSIRGRGVRGRGRGTWEGGGGRGRREFDHNSNTRGTWSSPREQSGGSTFIVDQFASEPEPEATTNSAPVGEEAPPESPMPEPKGSAEPQGEMTDDQLPVEPAAPEAKEMTLDEWKQQESNQRSVPHFNLRRAGEGEDPSNWRKLYRLNNKKVDGEEEGTEEEEDLIKKGRQKQLVEIEINFSDSRRRGRGSGMGRGFRGRGSRGGGGHKEQSQARAAPRVDDWNDFPSLITA